MKDMECSGIPTDQLPLFPYCFILTRSLVTDWFFFRMEVQEIFADRQDMETAFETLMLADGTLAIGHVDESTVTPLSAVSPSRNRLKNTIHSSPERNLSDFILEDNYLEDSWGLKSGITTGTFSHPEKSILNTSNLSEAISDQRIVSMTAPRARTYRLCWVSDSELDSISVDGKEDTSNCSKLRESSNLNQTDLSMNNRTSFESSFSESEEEIY